MQNSTTILGIIEMRLKGISYDDCCNRYSVGHSTVNLIMARYKEKGVPLEVLKQLPGTEIEASFYPPSNVRRKSENIMPDFEEIYSRINKDGSKANLYYMWLKYKKEHPSGYQYTQFCHYFNQYVRTHHGSQDLRMAVERIPGERVYIDWIGDQPEILVDPQTGELRKAHIFVTTVGVSSMIYAEAFTDEKLTNFVAGTVHALNYYGAVPKYLVPDNLRAAVTKHTKDELILNSAYQDLEQFYEVVILPPPARKPKGKATVEKGVQWLETHLLEDLKERVYYTMEELNRDVQRIIDNLNDRKIHGQSFSRREAFETHDKPKMRLLTNGHFTPCEYRYFARVPNNYHLLHDEHYYSVPYSMYDQPAFLKATMAEIRICDRNNKLVCTHRRSYTTFPKYITKTEHMPQEHRFYRDVNEKDGNYYRRWAAGFGPYTAKLIDSVLLSTQHEEQSYNSCNGILHMCTGQSKLLVEEASKLCVEGNACRYSYFKHCLKQLTEKGQTTERQKLPSHNNLRGKEAYK